MRCGATRLRHLRMTRFGGASPIHQPRNFASCKNSSADRPQLVEDLFLGREPPFVVFAEEELIVGGHFENAAAAADDLAVDAELFLDFSRQTGGSGKVVSNAAVVDSDVHCFFSGNSVRTSTAVMLSRPPRSFAASIRSWAAASRSPSWLVTRRRISSSGTMPVRPSEQSR